MGETGPGNDKPGRDCDAASNTEGAGLAEERVNAWETLFRRALDILDSAQRAGSMVHEWSFGGGTVLMRRYRHRVSTDIDIFVPDPQLLGYLSPRLNPVAESFTADYFEQANFLKLVLPQGEIDFVVAGFLTADPVSSERICGRDTRVETSAEIIAKKVWYRAAEFTARDLFDFALVADREPWSLERLREILQARRTVLLDCLADREAELREDFAALEVLDFRPQFDDCLAAMTDLLSTTSSHRAEQKRARYEVRKRRGNSRHGTGPTSFLQARALL